MAAYTYQIGEGVGDAVETLIYSESLYADSLGEAIDKAKAITKLRAPAVKETIVRLVQDDAGQYPLWASSAETIRNA